MNRSPARSGRRLSKAAAVACVAGTTLALGPGVAVAGPSGERVVRGTVQIARDGATTTITASNNSIINFRSFDIAADESVRFVQPGAQSRVLNRITGGSPTSTLTSTVPALFTSTEPTG